MRRLLLVLAAVLLGVAAQVAPAAAARAPCTARIGGACGAYTWAGWPGSNGFNTYVMDQAVNVQPGSRGHVTARGPVHWSTVADYTPCGGCVQTANMVQQQTNNWGSHGWNGNSDTPLHALTGLRVPYTESSPASPAATSPNQFEFATDIWTNYAGNACGGCGDVMAWVDTSPQRCKAVNGWAVFGQATVFGQGWTAYTPGGKGQEIILVLNGPGGRRTCAQQTSGTIHELTLIRWLSAHPGPTGFPAFSRLTMSLLNTGWEITAGNGSPYAVTRLAYRVTLRPRGGLASASFPRATRVRARR
jgi:hypothetical protein